MSGPVLDIARPRGVRRIWSWIRRSVLRLPVPRAHRAIQRTLTRVEDVEPVAPQRAQVRAAGPRPIQQIHAPVQKGLAEIPPLPHVVRELLRELSDPDSSARSVARIAASDPTLAASLIRTVNSAAMGLRQKVTSVTQAVSYLGYSTVRSLVIRMRLQNVLPVRPGQSAYDAEDLWVHSLAVAHAAEALAGRAAGSVDKGFVSTLGLLHDIGKLAINSYFPDSAARLRERNAELPDESFLDRERRLLGADHAEIGAMLAQHWKLPGDLVEAIRFHHAPAEVPASVGSSVRDAAILVHAANQLAKYCYVYSEDMEIDIVGDELLKRAGLPGPLTRLLNAPLRRAISRAIFFADDAAAYSAPLGAIRRFLRVSAQPDLPTLPPAAPARHEQQVGWADEDWESQIRGAHAIDCLPAATTRVEQAVRAAGNCAKLTSRATAGGIDRLLNASLKHLDHLSLDESAKLPARFVLRRLLPNLSEIAAAEPITVYSSLEDGVLLLAIACPALAFENRFPHEIERRVAKSVLNREMANVLNLRWFSQVQTPPDGAAVIFQSPLAGE